MGEKLEHSSEQVLPKYKRSEWKILACIERWSAHQSSLEGSKCLLPDGKLIKISIYHSSGNRCKSRNIFKILNCNILKELKFEKKKKKENQPNKQKTNTKTVFLNVNLF